MESKKQYCFFDNVPKKKRSSLVSSKSAVKPPINQHDDSIDVNDETIKIVLSALLLLGQNPTHTESNAISPPPKQNNNNNNKKRKCDSSSSPSLKTMMRRRKRASADAAEFIDSKDAQLPVWMTRRIEEMGGSNVTIVFQKKLYLTDVNRLNCRLSMPLSKIKNFLSEEERKWLDETTPTTEEDINDKKKNKKKINKTNKKHPNSLAVKMIDSNGNIVEEELNVKKWMMGRERKTVIYNLVTGWNHVVKSNGLKEGMKVQLWSFRVQSHLWFALVRVDSPGASTAS